MKNTNKNLIVGLGIGLVILAILAVGSMLMPTKAHAGYATYRFSTDDNNAPLYPEKREVVTVYKPIYETQPVVYKTQPVVYQTQPVYQNTTYSNSYSNGPEASTNNTTVSDKPTYTGSDAYGNLAANSVFGKFSFMPSGLMQWILLAIFILVIIILVRKVTSASDDYHHSPLKHA